MSPHQYFAFTINGNSLKWWWWWWRLGQVRDQNKYILKHFIVSVRHSFSHRSVAFNSFRLKMIVSIAHQTQTRFPMPFFALLVAGNEMVSAFCYVFVSRFRFQNKRKHSLDEKRAVISNIYRLWCVLGMVAWLQHSSRGGGGGNGDTIFILIKNVLATHSTIRKGEKQRKCKKPWIVDNTHF